MDGNLAIGLLLVLSAGVLQGTFILPMTMTRRWEWEHSWGTFSLLAMLVFNWAIAAAVIPGIFAAYRATPGGDLLILALLGLLWGLGAILFGLGMAKLGMALGYPVIMGLLLSLGALIPLIIDNPKGLLSGPGLLILGGSAVVIFGIVLCARAAGLKDPASSGAPGGGSLRAGLTIAILAGILSGLPNVGMSAAKSLKAASAEQGASEAMAGNAAWAILFTMGAAVNMAYCLVLLGRRKTFASLKNDLGRNLGLIALMSLLWIGSFYLYGLGAARMGSWGLVVGWPLFISLAILIGNVLGLWRGEWRAAPRQARSLLAWGLAVLILSVVLFGIAARLKAGS
jgi:L-rhamnose-H+ transport protein